MAVKGPGSPSWQRRAAALNDAGRMRAKGASLLGLGRCAGALYLGDALGRRQAAREEGGAVGGRVGL